MAYECFNLLITGDLLNAVVCPYTLVMGAWFYALMILTMIAGQYLKSHSITFVAVSGIILGTSAATLLPPETHQFAYVMIALASAGILYKALKSR